MSRVLPLIKMSCQLVFLMLCVGLFGKALFTYQGSKLTYFLFSISYFLLLILALKNRKTYSYLFLALFLWLGFWLKFTWHTIFNYDYIEAIGTFIPNALSLDQVLFISTIGCWGVLLAGHLPFFKNFQSTVYTRVGDNKSVPAFYTHYRKMFMPILIVLIIAVSCFNASMGIGMSGMVPQVKLMWPLNAIIYWLLAIGFALMMATILWWEVLSERKASSSFVYALSEPFSTSISILSRATYIFHVVPIALSLVLNRRLLQITFKKIHFFAVCVLAAMLFVVSLQCVSWLRNYYYSGVTVSQSIASPQNSVLLHTTSSLIVDRWLGVEGVMAIASYPNKQLSLLEEALLEKAELGKIGMYQKIANSHYLKMDTSRFMFATIPGPIAFFYYSGSLLIVFVGMFIFTLLMVLSEQAVSYLLGNIFLNALYGMYAANAVAQFGLTPHLLTKQFFLIFVYLLVVFILQKWPSATYTSSQKIQ